MNLGIDASNIRAGGTVTHLVELLSAAQPQRHGFERVIVWGGSSVLSRLPSRSWLDPAIDPLLEQSGDPFQDRRHLSRLFWQRFKLKRAAQKAACDVLFVPGGLDSSGFSPMVTMSQNMLPFEEKESRRYGVSLSRARLLALRLGQARTFRRASGVIFLTEYARNTILESVPIPRSNTVVIPHGIGKGFFQEPRVQRPLSECTRDNPFRITYVSTVDLYKHQWHVAAAVKAIRSRNWPVVVDFVGPARNVAIGRLRSAIAELDPRGEFITYQGAVDYLLQPAIYRRSDLCVFASSCENLPIILLEGMASGLPIASSSRGPMPEVLDGGGIFFDPERIDEMEAAIAALIEDPALREAKARIAFNRASEYSWAKCAGDTFSFLARCSSGA